MLKGNTNEKRIWNYLIDKGISEAGAAGLMGNLKAESGLNPNNLQNSFNKKFNITDEQYTQIVNNNTYIAFATDSAGYGLAQWTSPGRKKGLYDLTRARGRHIDDLETQLDYLWQELTGAYKNVLNGIKNAVSIKEASDLVLLKYEKPKDKSPAVKELRAAYGREIFERNAEKKQGTAGETASPVEAEKIINIALNEVGYLEKSKSAYMANPAILDEKTAGAGTDNYTKYGRDMHKIFPSVMDFPAPWCDAFVDWCFYMAYGIATAKSLVGGNFDDYTVASAKMYKDKNALDCNPTVGAQVFFTKNGYISGCTHTGLVYKIDKDHFYTVEGNTSVKAGVYSNGGGVAQKKYNKLNYVNRTLFGHPKYELASSGKAPATAKPGREYKDGATYQTTANLFIRRSPYGDKIPLNDLKEADRKNAIPSENGEAILKKGTKITALEIKLETDGSIWLKIESGYICAATSTKAYTL